MNRFRSGALAVLFGGVLSFAVGCSDGPKMYDVSGTLTVDGTVPAAGSSITFIPIDGKGTSAGCTVENGKYTTKALPGSYKVEIHCPKIVGKPKAQSKDEYQTQGDIVVESLPAKYHDQTELTFEVKAGKNEKNWNLKTK